MTIMRAAYPNFYKDFDEEIFAMQRGMWQDIFKDCPYKEMFAILEFWISTEKYPPTVACLNRLIRRNRNPEAFISAEQAWEQVSIAVRKFGWCNQDKAMEFLAPNVRRAVQYIGGWQKLCKSESKEWDFRRKDFLDVYEEFENETQKQELIPTHVLERLEREGQKRIEFNKAAEIINNDLPEM